MTHLRPTIALLVGIPLLCAWCVLSLAANVCDWAVVRLNDWTENE